jgi:hypothetical protein
MTIPIYNMDDYEFYDEFEDYNFDHTDIFIFNHDKREIELRSELWLLYTTCVVGWTVFVVSTFLANSSMEYRRYVNRVFDTIVYDTETEMESDSESDSGGDTESEGEESEGEESEGEESETESDTYEPDEASEEEDYDIPQPDYNESNMMEGIYRLD